MILRPTRSTRTDTLFPYTTRCRSPARRWAIQTRLRLVGHRDRRRTSPRSLVLAGLRVHAAVRRGSTRGAPARCLPRSEEHTSELQSLMRISYAVFCLKKKKSAYTQHMSEPTCIIHKSLYTVT